MTARVSAAICATVIDIAAGWPKGHTAVVKGQTGEKATKLVALESPTLAVQSHARNENDWFSTPTTSYEKVHPWN